MLYGIHLLTSRENDHPIETATCEARNIDAAIVNAKSLFYAKRKNNPEVIGLRIFDNSKAGQPQLAEYFPTELPDA